MGKKSESGSGIRDEQPGSYFLELRNHFFGLKYLNSLMRIRIRDPGWKQLRSGIRDLGWKKVGSGIRDKHLGSATLGTLIQKMYSSYLLDYRLLHYDSLEVLASFWPFAE
jgi:hypothetical protein